MASLLSPGSPEQPIYPYVIATEDALAVARQAQHIASSTQPLIGFSNGLPGYANACFRNSLISVLINCPPLSGWVVSNTQGQLDSSPILHLLENVIREFFGTNLAGKQARADGAIQRLHNYFNLRPKPIDATNVNTRYEANTQQDAVEVLYDIMADIQTELGNNGAASLTFSVLTGLLTTATVACGQCGRATHRANPDDDNRRETTLRTHLTRSIRTFDDLVRSAFADDDPPNDHCSRCGTLTPRRVQWKILRPPEVLLIDADQVHPTKGGGSTKPGFQVPTIPEELDLAGYLHDAAASTARYRLHGVVNHQGRSVHSGHYTNHVRRPSGSWVLLDDSKVSLSSVSNLQKYDPALGVNQMIPRLIAYVKIPDDEDDNAITTRAATVQPGPRAFRQPQIIYNDWMTLAELRALCTSHSLPPGNAKTIQSLVKVIDTANSANSTFATRLKGWLITTLLSTGMEVDRSKTKLKLAAQLKSFMKNQPVRTQGPQAPGTGSRQDQASGKGGKSDTKVEIGDSPSGRGGNLASRDILPADKGGDQPQAQGDSSNLSTQQALDAARIRIAELEATIADLQGQLQSVDNKAATRASPARSTRLSSTASILDLIHNLPPVSSPPCGTKRSADNEKTLSPEAHKRRAIQLAGRICAAIDAGVAPGGGASGDQRRSSDEENQRPARKRISPPPPLSSPSTDRSGRLRCHPCPLIVNEIHHMHTHVCGWMPRRRVSSPTRSEIVEDAAIAAERLRTGEDEDEIPNDETRRLPFFRTRLPVLKMEMRRAYS